MAATSPRWVRSLHHQVDLPSRPTRRLGMEPLGVPVGGLFSSLSLLSSRFFFVLTYLRGVTPFPLIGGALAPSHAPNVGQAVARYTDVPTNRPDPGLAKNCTSWHTRVWQAGVNAVRSCGFGRTRTNTLSTA